MSTGNQFNWSEYTRNYRKNNPEKVDKWKTNASVRHLLSKGYTVIAPQDRQDGGEQGK